MWLLVAISSKCDYKYIKLKYLYKKNENKIPISIYVHDVVCFVFYEKKIFLFKFMFVSFFFIGKCLHCRLYMFQIFRCFRDFCYKCFSSLSKNSFFSRFVNFNNKFFLLVIFSIVNLFDLQFFQLNGQFTIKMIHFKWIDFFLSSFQTEQKIMRKKILFFLQKNRFRLDFIASQNTFFWNTSLIRTFTLKID